MLRMPTHHAQVCSPHRLWIDRAVESLAQNYPKIVAVQQRHDRRPFADTALMQPVLRAGLSVLAVLLRHEDPQPSPHRRSGSRCPDVIPGGGSRFACVIVQ
jgi:hypothetical protein